MSPRKNWVRWIAVVGLAFGLGVMAACTADSPSAPSAQEQAQQTAEERKNYVPQNDVEGRNYNSRQRLADDPATIIWCSVYPSNPNVKAFTVPIAGKLTSGNKRPYPTERTFHGGADGGAPAGDDFYTPELPGSDAFYGISGEYRYGFDPTMNYHDFYNIEMYCTSVPTIIQKQTTLIGIANPEADLSSLDRQAEVALTNCIKQQGIKKDEPIFWSACPEAARILGVE